MANPKTPLHTVLFGMFPNALRALAEHAQFGNEKHNPGEPLHWSFDKSTQHADCVLSHLAKAGQTDPETGKSHTIAVLWRACALLETELVNAGAEPGFAVRFEGEAKGQPERWYVQFNVGGPADWIASESIPGEFVSEAEANRAIDAYCEREKAQDSRHEWRPAKAGSK